MLAKDAFKALKTDKSILWHYTSFAAAESILKNNELWASDFRFLNDWTELQHALELSRKVFRKALPTVHHMIEKLLTTKTVAPSAEFLSFSKQFNSLEQFRGYSHQSVGVAVGFDETLFDVVASNCGFGKSQCLYRKEEKKRALMELRDGKKSQIDHFNQIVDDPNTPEPDKWRAMKQPGIIMQQAVIDYLQLAASFKHFSFRREREIRYASVPRGTYMLAPMASRFVNREPERSYVQRGTEIKPIAKIPLTVEGCQHPLKAILFGPSFQANVLRQRADLGDSREWLSRLLNKDRIGLDSFNRLLDIPVAFSNIPLRG